jgi:hypothetical protein
MAILMVKNKITPVGFKLKGTFKIQKSHASSPLGNCSPSCICHMDVANADIAGAIYLSLQSQGAMPLS